MRGCKFGTVVRIDHDQLFGEVVVVRMDNRRVRKLQRLLPGSLQRYLP
jgi:vacuolar-type H+-ATPase catalytic subunit A/Vma1